MAPSGSPPPLRTLAPALTASSTGPATRLAADALISGPMTVAGSADRQGQGAGSLVAFTSPIGAVAAAASRNMPSARWTMNMPSRRSRRSRASSSR